MWSALLPFKLSKRSRVLILVAYALLSCCFLYMTMGGEAPKKGGRALRYFNSITKEEEKQPSFRFFNSSKVFNASYTPYLAELGLIGERDDFVDLSQPLPNVTFVTALSENHAGEGRSLVIRLAKDHPNWKIYIYDIGMNNTSRGFFENAWNVGGVRHVDLAHFGVDGDLFTYRWKPIIIAKALQEFPVVFYIDTSTFFGAHITITNFVNRINITDNQGPNVYMVNGVWHSTFAVTSAGMYDYLAPQEDIYRPQYEAGKMLFVRTKATIDLALKWFVLCALEKSCMAPVGHKLDCRWQNGDVYTYDDCHRSDQSSMNLILGAYPTSFLGGWASEYVWTQRNITAELPFRFFNSSKVFNASYTPYLAELGLIGEREDFVDLSQPLPNVTFVTAISENHAGEARALVIRLAKDHPNWKIYVYDMGMTDTSRSFFERACNVAGVRDVDLAHFGANSDLITYRWKAIVIADALKEFPIVFWIDSSTFFAANITMKTLLNGINVTDSEGPHVYMIDLTVHSGFATTTPAMYDYLAPQGNTYRPQFQANKMLFVRTKATIELAVKWFVLCSLESACMAPPKAKLDCGSWHTDNIYTYKNCHRYDQSAINLILLPYKNICMGGCSTRYAWTDREQTMGDTEVIC